MLKPVRFRWRGEMDELNLRCFLNWRSPIGGFLFVAAFGKLACHFGWDKTFLEYPYASAIGILLAMHALKNLRVSWSAARLGHRRAAFCCGLLTLAYLVFFVAMAPVPLPRFFQSDSFFHFWLSTGFALIVGGFLAGRGAFADACPQTVTLR